MQISESNLIAIILVIAFLTFAIFWAFYANRRLRPLLRQKLGHLLGVNINERFIGRGNQAWIISGQATRGQSCLVTGTQLAVDFGCVVMPIFCALLTMGLLMFALLE